MSAPTTTVSIHVDHETDVAVSTNRTAEGHLYGTLDFGPDVNVFISDASEAYRVAAACTSLAQLLASAAAQDVPA